MYALYEHGDDGDVFFGERFSKTPSSAQGVNLIPAGQLLSFSLDVFNPGSSSSPWETKGQTSGTVQWKIVGKNLQKDGTTGKLKLMDMTLNDTFAVEETLSSTTEPDGTTLLGVGIMDAGDLKPSVVYKAGLLGNKIVQGNPCPNAPINPMTITLVPSVPMPAFQENQTSIVFSNFHGAVFEDGQYVHVSGSGAENIGYSGRWRAKESSVTVNITKQLDAGKQYVFSFNVTNPEVNQSGSNITVHTTGVIQSIVVGIINETNACGCEDGHYIFVAEDGYQGSGFEARLKIQNGKITSRVMKSGGSGYNSTPPLKMSKYVELGLNVKTERVSCTDPYNCGKCLSTTCNLGAARRMLRANIEGIAAIHNLTIWCTSSHTDTAVTLDVTEGGFGSGFEGRMSTRQEGAFNVTNTITIVNPGAGYMHIPYSINASTMAGCECTKHGAPTHADPMLVPMCRCQGPYQIIQDY